MNIRRGIRAGFGAAMIAIGACQSITDPGLPDSAERFAALPVYDLWWQLTESCSGKVGALSAVQWYRAPAAAIAERKGPGVAGYWSAAGNRIIVASDAAESGAFVRHVMLHALLRGGGHSRGYFLDRCAGVVNCEEACRAEAGSVPEPSLSVPRVSPGALEIGAAVSPVAPSSAHYGGFFTLTATARNSADHAVVVQLPPSFDAGPPSSFSFRREQDGGYVWNDARADDPAVTYFRAGEVKRFVFDFRLNGPSGQYGVPPGTYLMRGAYGRVWSSPVQVTVSP